MLPICGDTPNINDHPLQVAHSSVHGDSDNLGGSGLSSQKYGELFVQG